MYMYILLVQEHNVYKILVHGFCNIIVLVSYLLIACVCPLATYSQACQGCIVG